MRKLDYSDGEETMNNDFCSDCGEIHECESVSCISKLEQVVPTFDITHRNDFGGVCCDLCELEHYFECLREAAESRIEEEPTPLKKADMLNEIINKVLAP